MRPPTERQRRKKIYVEEERDDFAHPYKLQSSIVLGFECFPESMLAKVFDK